MRIQKKCELGISTLVVIFVLCVIALVGACTWGIMSYIKNSKNIDRMHKDVADIVLTVQALSMKHKDFSVLNGVTDAEFGRRFLERLNVSTETPFKGKTYYSVVYDPDYPDMFSVYIVNLPYKHCSSLKFNKFPGAFGGGCGANYANIMFAQSQKKVGVAVAVDPKVGVTETKDRYGLFFRKMKF